MSYPGTMLLMRVVLAMMLMLDTHMYVCGTILEADTNSSHAGWRHLLSHGAPPLSAPLHRCCFPSGGGMSGGHQRG